MDTKLRTEAKNDFEKDFFKLMEKQLKMQENIEILDQQQRIRKEINQRQNLIIVQYNIFQKI